MIRGGEYIHINGGMSGECCSYVCMYAIGVDGGCDGKNEMVGRCKYACLYEAGNMDPSTYPLSRLHVRWTFTQSTFIAVW